MSVKVVIIVCATLLASCSNYEVNTADRWCEYLLSGNGNFAEQHAPWWAIFPSVSYDGDAIRHDFVRQLNGALMQKVGRRADRMVWQKGTELHIENLSSLMVVDEEKVISGWRNGIARANAGNFTGSADKCLYGTVTSMFDSVIIHSAHWGPMRLKVVSEDKTVLDTNRHENIKNPL